MHKFDIDVPSLALLGLGAYPRMVLSLLDHNNKDMTIVMLFHEVKARLILSSWAQSARQLFVFMHGLANLIHFEYSSFGVSVRVLDRLSV